MKRLLFILLALAGVAAAQPGPVSIRPDCFQFFTFTATGTSNTFDNRSAGCPYFAIAYSSSGFTVESIVVQVAPDNAGVPGTWATYTANSGSNPNTAITQASSTFSGYFPWLRVNLTSVTGSGSISGIVYGWRTQAALIAGGGAAACAGTAATPCVVAGPAADGAAVSGAPVRIGAKDGSGNTQDILTNTAGNLDPAGLSTAQADGVSNTLNVPSAGGAASSQPAFPYLFNGSTWDRSYYCTNQVTVALTDGTRTQLVALSGSTVIRVCHLHFTTGTPEDITISNGTGAACGTGTTTIDKYLSSQYLALDFQPAAALRAPAANALCITQTGTQNAQVTVIYAQY